MRPWSFILCCILALWLIPAAGCAMREENGEGDYEPRAALRSPVERPDPAILQVPPGFRAEVAMSHLTGPTSVECDDRGNIYIAEADDAPRILRISSSGEIDVMTDRLDGPVHDLLFHQGRLYIAQGTTICSMDPEGKLDPPAQSRPADAASTPHAGQAQLPPGQLYIGSGGRVLLAPNGLADGFATMLPPGKIGIDQAGLFGNIGDILVAYFGGTHASTPGQVLRIDPVLGTRSAILASRPTLAAGDQALRHPIDLCITPDGSALYILDYGSLELIDEQLRPVRDAGVLWRVTRLDRPRGLPPGNLSPPPGRHIVSRE